MVLNQITFQARSGGNQQIVFVVDQIDIAAHHVRVGIATNATVDDSIVVRGFQEPNGVLRLQFRNISAINGDGGDNVNSRLPLLDV